MIKRLGKLTARRDSRTLALFNYASAIAAPPASCNLTSKMSSIGMMKNDQLGDCTCAAVGHIIQQWTAEKGSQVILPDDTIVTLYSAVAGYDPNDPSTDNGAVEMDVLNYWIKHPVAGHALQAYCYINSKKLNELKLSVYLFGNAYIGMQLPNFAQNQNSLWYIDPNAKQEDMEPGSWGGHAVPVVAYDSNYVYCITWGKILPMTWSFYSRYCDEAYALLSLDWVTKVSNAPNGFNLSTLQKDLHGIKSA